VQNKLFGSSIRQRLMICPRNFVGAGNEKGYTDLDADIVKSESD